MKRFIFILMMLAMVSCKSDFEYKGSKAIQACNNLEDGDLVVHKLTKDTLLVMDLFSATMNVRDSNLDKKYINCTEVNKLNTSFNYGNQ